MKTVSFERKLDEPSDYLGYNETEKAICVFASNGSSKERPVWLPKSQVTISKFPDSVIIQIPLWLVKKNYITRGLTYFHELN